MIGRLKDLLRLAGGEWVISFVTREDPGRLWDELKDHAVRVEIKKASKHRSLSANNYAWALIDQIAVKMAASDPKGKWSPEKVYRHAIREIGGISDYYGMKEEAYDNFCKVWTSGHLGRQVEVIPGSTRPGG